MLTLWDSLFEAWPIDDVAPPLLTAVVAAGAVGSKDKLMSCSNAAEAMAAVLSPGVPLVSGPYTDDGVEVRRFCVDFCIAPPLNTPAVPPPYGPTGPHIPPLVPI